MSATQVQSSPAAEIRARLAHPVVDGDAHVIECEFAICDFLRQVAGPEMARRYEDSKKRRISSVRHRQTWWNSPSGPHTIDRATVMLPKLYRERLDEAGIDFAVVYTTEGLGAMHVADAEMRRALHRALNTMYADMFSGVKDRLTPSAVIPMHTPEEAVAELEYVANTLKLKTVTVNTEIRRDGQLTSPAIDQGRVYDPVWQKLIDLKLSVACHNRS